MGRLSEVLVSSVVSGSTRCLCHHWEPSSGSWCGLCLRSESQSEFTYLFFSGGCSLPLSDWCGLFLNSGDPYVWHQGMAAGGGGGTGSHVSSLGLLDLN